MSVSVRPVIVPGLALAAAIIAVAPTVTAPQHVPLAAPPTVHVEELQLAGIGQDIYTAITTVVQQAVGGVSYIVNFIPLVGGLAAAQININYFQGIQPLIEATVNYAASIVQNPLNFITEHAQLRQHPLRHRLQLRLRATAVPRPQPAAAVAADRLEHPRRAAHPRAGRRPRSGCPGRGDDDLPGRPPPTVPTVPPARPPPNGRSAPPPASPPARPRPSKPRLPTQPAPPPTASPGRHRAQGRREGLSRAPAELHDRLHQPGDLRAHLVEDLRGLPDRVRHVGPRRRPATADATPARSPTPAGSNRAINSAASVRVKVRRNWRGASSRTASRCSRVIASTRSASPAIFAVSWRAAKSAGSPPRSASTAGRLGVHRMADHRAGAGTGGRNPGSDPARGRASRSRAGGAADVARADEQDVHEPLHGVAEGRTSHCCQPSRPEVWLRPTPGCTLYEARSAGQAPLAQSVERFHGKEKVNGSIPLGGSVDVVLERRRRHGGVAQLVRAHDS